MIVSEDGCLMCLLLIRRSFARAVEWPGCGMEPVPRPGVRMYVHLGYSGAWPAAMDVFDE